MTSATTIVPGHTAELAERSRIVVRLLVIYALPWFVFVPHVAIPGTPLSLDDLIPLGIALLGLGVRALGVRPRFEAVTATLVALAIVSLIASVASSGSDTAVIRSAARGFGRTLVHVALMVTIALSLAGTGDVRRMLALIVGSATVQSLFCLWAYAVNYTGPGGIGVAPTPAWTTLRRVHGTFASGTSWEGGAPVGSNFLSAYLMCAAVAAIGLALASDRWLYKLVWFVAAALCVLGIGVSFTRTSFVGLAVGLLVLAALSRRFTVVVAMITIGVVSLVAVPELGGRLRTLNNNRFALYTSAVRIAEDHPLTGVGTGNYLAVLKSSSRYQYTPFGKAISTPHNSVLLAACQSGWVAGLLLAIAVLLGLARMAFLAVWLRDRSPRIFAATLAAAGAAFVLQDQVNNLFLVPKTATFFWIFVALALVVERAQGGLSQPRSRLRTSSSAAT